MCVSAHLCMCARVHTCGDWMLMCVCVHVRMHTSVSDASVCECTCGCTMHMCQYVSTHEYLVCMVHA